MYSRLTQFVAEGLRAAALSIKQETALCLINIALFLALNYLYVFLAQPGEEIRQKLGYNFSKKEAI